MEMIRVKVLRESTKYAELFWNQNDNHYVWLSLQHIESVTLWGEVTDILMDSGNLYTVENVNVEELDKWKID